MYRTCRHGKVIALGEFTLLSFDHKNYIALYYLHKCIAGCLVNRYCGSFIKSHQCSLSVIVFNQISGHNATGLIFYCCFEFHNIMCFYYLLEIKTSFSSQIIGI